MIFIFENIMICQIRVSSQQYEKNWKWAFEYKFFFQDKEWLIKVFISINDVKMKFRTITTEWAVDLAIQFPKKSFLRHMVFTETNH